MSRRSIGRLKKGRGKIFIIYLYVSDPNCTHKTTPAGGVHAKATTMYLVQCPFDPGHQVPHRSLERHKESCLLKKMDYSSEEQEQMPDTSFCYKNTNKLCFVRVLCFPIRIVHGAVSDILFCSSPSGQYSGEPVEVPQNHKRALCDLTVADRLALYDHVTSELSNQEDPAPSSSNEDLYVDLVKKLQKDEEQKEPKTHLELMAEMRDYKRRRQSYRAKNVHITKKSYTEVLSCHIQYNTTTLQNETTYKSFSFFFFFSEIHTPLTTITNTKRRKRREGERRGRGRKARKRRERTSEPHYRADVIRRVIPSSHEGKGDAV
uniref:CHHC U11-48K-type domain-containing protein n=1 Tax=Periophthalmus magnuspinnatus TaxID=409849 RepID=A0A3B3ZZH6_9GOBI